MVGVSDIVLRARSFPCETLPLQEFIGIIQLRFEDRF